MGYVIADWILTVLVLLCAIAHIAILRAPEIHESKIIEHVRWIKIAGFSILTLRYGYVMATDGDIFIQPETEMGLTLVLAAEFYRTVYRLFQGTMDSQYEERSQRKNKGGSCKDS